MDFISWSWYLISHESCSSMPLVLYCSVKDLFTFVLLRVLEIYFILLPLQKEFFFDDFVGFLLIL